MVNSPFTFTGGQIQFSGSGTESQNGNNYSSYHSSATYGLSGNGSWNPVSGNGSTSGNSFSSFTYNGGGGYSYNIGSGSGSVSGTFQKSGDNGGSVSYNTSATLSTSGWDYTGWQSTSSSSHSYQSLSGSGSFNIPASSQGFAFSGTTSESGGQSSYNQQSAYYILSGSGSDTWQQTAGTGASGGHTWQWSSQSGSYSHAVSGVTLRGTFSQSGSVDDTSGYTTGGSSGSGSGGQWLPSGTGSDTLVTSASYGYSGSGSAVGVDLESVSSLPDGAGGPAYGSGTQWESVSASTSVDHTTYYTMGSDGAFSATGGSGTTTGNGDDEAGYSGGGQYQATVAVGSDSGMVQGSFSQSQSGGTAYSYGTSDVFSGGAWTAASGSGSTSVFGGGKFSYSGGGDFSLDSGGDFSVDSGTGTLSQSGAANESYNYVKNYTVSNGQWTAGAASGSGSGSGTDSGSGSGSGGANGSGWTFSSYSATLPDSSETLGGIGLSGDDTLSGSDRTSYSFQTAAVYNGVDWQETGVLTAGGSGNASDSFSGGADGLSLAMPASWGLPGVTATASGNAASGTSYTETEVFFLDDNGTWQASGGVGALYSNSAESWSEAGSGNATAFALGWSVNGAANAAFGGDTSSNASETLTEGGNGWQFSGGAGSTSVDGWQDASYNGSGSCSANVYGNMLPGTADARYAQSASYQYTQQYTFQPAAGTAPVSGGQWTCTSGSGGASGYGSTFQGASASAPCTTSQGDYTYSGPPTNGPWSGTMEGWQNQSTRYNYDTQSQYAPATGGNPGGWVSWGNGTAMTAGSSGESFDCTAPVQIWYTGEPINNGYLDGNVSASGNDSSSYHYTEDYSLASGASAWSVTSGVGNVVGNDWTGDNALVNANDSSGTAQGWTSASNGCRYNVELTYSLADQRWEYASGSGSVTTSGSSGFTYRESYGQTQEPFSCANVFGDASDSGGASSSYGYTENYGVDCNGKWTLTGGSGGYWGSSGYSDSYVGQGKAEKLLDNYGDLITDGVDQYSGERYSLAYSAQAVLNVATMTWSFTGQGGASGSTWYESSFEGGGSGGSVYGWTYTDSENGSINANSVYDSGPLSVSPDGSTWAAGSASASGSMEVVDDYTYTADNSSQGVNEDSYGDYDVLTTTTRNASDINSSCTFVESDESGVYGAISWQETSPTQYLQYGNGNPDLITLTTAQQPFAIPNCSQQGGAGNWYDEAGGVPANDDVACWFAAPSPSSTGPMNWSASPVLAGNTAMSGAAPSAAFASADFPAGIFQSFPATPPFVSAVAGGAGGGVGLLGAVGPAPDALVLSQWPTIVVGVWGEGFTPAGAPRTPLAEGNEDGTMSSEKMRGADAVFGSNNVAPAFPVTDVYAVGNPLNGVSAGGGAPANTDADSYLGLLGLDAGWDNGDDDDADDDSGDDADGVAAGPMAAAAAETPASGAETFNSQGQLATLTNADGGATSFSYATSGSLASLTDPDGNTTSWTYNSQNQVTQETNSLGNSDSLAYNSAGQLVGYTDADGNVRTYQYDSAGHVATETLYASAADEAAGNAEDTLNFAYDSAGNLVSESDDSASDTYAYDSQNRLTSATEAEADTPTVVMTYTYSGTSTEPSGVSVTIGGVADYEDSYSYNSAGQLTQIVRTAADPSGGDAVAEETVDLSYNSSGQLQTIDRYQGGQLAVEADYSYDSAGRLTGLVYEQGATVLASYSYTYAAAASGEAASASASTPWLPSGAVLPADSTQNVNTSALDEAMLPQELISSVTTLSGSTQYSYDAEGQLTAATYSGVSAQPNESYAYDANGNRTSSTSSAPVVIGKGNEVLFDGTYTYTYDADGNCTARFIDANGTGVLQVGDTDVTQYTWDAGNRLVQVTQTAVYGGAASQIVTYLYDAEGRWIGENIENGSGVVTHETRFIYDGNQIVLQFDCTPLAPREAGSDAINASGEVQMTANDLSHRYLWGPAVDELLSDEQLPPLSSPSSTLSPAGAGTLVFPLTDNVGTVRDLAICDLTSSETSVVNHLTYNSFGQVLSQTNPSTGSTAAVDCLFGFTGLPFDNASGTYRTLNRPYDPATGKFLDPDPTGLTAGDTNEYRYCGNSPANATDPTGLAGMGHHPIAKKDVLKEIPGLSERVIDFIWGYTTNAFEPGTHFFNTAHREYDDYVLELFREEFAKTGEWDAKALSKLTPEDFKRFIDNIIAGRNPFKGTRDARIAEYFAKDITPNLQRSGMAVETVEDAISRRRKFRASDARKAARQAAKAAQSEEEKIVQDLEKAIDNDAKKVGNEVEKEVLEEAKKKLPRELKAAEKEAEEALKLGKKGGRILKKLGRAAPGVGIFLIVYFGTESAKAKGPVNGTTEAVLDQTPIVGEVKAVIEIVSGEDLIPPDEQKPEEYNPPVHGKVYIPSAERANGYKYLPGENQFWWDLFGLRPDVDGDGLGPAGN